jgi:ElaB/YqjD/DUF883 family membrane-anchored ribosome-binding protein
MPNKKDKKSKKADKAAKVQGAFESLGQKLDETPPVKAAEEALARAKAELDKSLHRYRETRDAAREQLRGLGEKNLGDVLDATLKSVSKHPGRGVVVSLLVGLFLGRLFRR